MYSGALIKKAKSEGTDAPLGQIFLNGLLTALGASLGVFGTFLSIKSSLKQ